MDLRIKGRKALITGASRGLGKACAQQLAAEGVDLMLVARQADTLGTVADELRRLHGVRVDTIAADLSLPQGRQTVLAACADPDIFVHSSGWPKSRTDFRGWSNQEWHAALDAMMLAPIELIQGTIDGMVERRYGRIITVTSHFVKMPPPNLALSVSPRLGLAGFMAGLAREVAPYNVTFNAALPGIFATETQLAHGQALAERAGRSFEEIWQERESTNAARRFGKPEEFAALCAYLCSEQAGFMTGQHLLIDGGGYPGTF